MSTGEAQVKFTEIGSQQVVTAFKNVGSAAGTASTNVGSAGNAIKNVGTGMKNTASQIGNMATAFATLALSVVNTWRAYRDLNDQQLAIDKTTKKLHATELAISNLQKSIAADRAANAKGSLNSAEAAAKIDVAEQNLNKHRKDGKHTAAQLRLEDIQLQKLRKAGVGDTAALTAKEEKLKIMEEGLANTKTQLKQQQKSYNDTVQDFYLSIAPLALSSIGSLSQAFGGIKGMLGGGASGLIGSFGGLGLVLGGASLAILAYQNNWLGFKDIVGGVIKWFQDRVGVWKETFGSIFDSIKKGDWNGAFAKIKAAAIAFWNDLTRSVWIFANIDKIIEDFKKGDWRGAFHEIAIAATIMWQDLVKAVPFFGGVETFIKQLSAGDWKGAFNTVAAGIKTGLESILGAGTTEKIILKFQLMKDSAITEFNLMKDGLTKPGGPIDLIQQGLAKLGKGDIVGGFTGIWTGFDKAVGIFTTRVNDWVKLNFGIDLAALNAQANTIGGKILEGIKGGLTFISRTWLDPFVSSLFKAETWSAALSAQTKGITATAQNILNFLFGFLSTTASDPAAQAKNLIAIGTAIWNGITGWLEVNSPDTKKAMETLAGSFLKSLGEAGNAWHNLGVGIWNAIIDALKSSNLLSGALGGVLDKLKLSPIVEPKIPPDVMQKTRDTISKALQIPPPIIKPTADNSKMKATIKNDLNKVMRGHYPIPITADMSAAEKKWQAFAKKVQMTTLQVKIAGTSVNIRKGSQAGAYGGPKKHAQGGMHEHLSRDTLIQAHKGEDVHIDKPSKMANVTGKGGGVFTGPAIIKMEDGAQFKAWIRATVNEDSGTMR